MLHNPLQYNGLWQVSLVGVLLLIGGCSDKFAARSSQTASSGSIEKSVLVSQEQAEARRVMRSTLQRAGAEPQPPYTGLRWSDLPAGVTLAVADEEMAVVRYEYMSGEESVASILEADRALFHLKTVDDQPAEVEVRRTLDERIYEAQANVGLFAEQTQRAQQLLSSLDRRMRELGEKRSIREK